MAAQLPPVGNNRHAHLYARYGIGQLREALYDSLFWSRERAVAAEHRCSFAREDDYDACESLGDAAAKAVEEYNSSLADANALLTSLQLAPLDFSPI